MSKVAVIGAGAGGLSAARHLVEAGQTVTIFEKGSRIGGLWVYDNDNGLSAAYESLHINSEPRVTHFRDFPFPDKNIIYPSHRDVAEYLELFADRMGLSQFIDFNASVASVEPLGGVRDNGWLVRLEDGRSESFDSVVVATGHQGVPAHPGFATDFSGDYRHSHDYRHPLEFAGKRVLVIGVGNSGLDIASDVCSVAAATFVSARSPVLVMPRSMFGLPIARVIGAVNKPWLPWSIQRRTLRLLSYICYGSMEQWGMVTPTTRTHPSTNATFMAHVMYRRIIVKPGVERAIGRKVEFADGSSEEFDTIIAATGYEIDLPFLSERYTPVVERRIETYKRVVHPSWPGLYFIGFFNVAGGSNISMMDVQSAWMTALITGKLDTPSETEMRHDIRAEQEWSARRYPDRPRYGLELDPVRYRAKVAEEFQAPMA
jgi:dimethylaniline monooxygenase (N-oxide forming)